ncbi:hypothetical protein A1O1_01133 [Capronia coronata CBS 617.96]|uniref:Uncharacterized protein n=1 Tax=Capronia coronata CBS 617.96 TaxID=1182541 RepID=W9YSY3_9EURO|nr:uncharacterized protein A1O1_01133 [Capronia coronata CBS 617.96]EXJ96007.1 hypothetical protein A1O1_01133 [Capronia coronata CBS 617.96]
MSSTDEIVESLTRIYQLFIEIDYISESVLKVAPHGPEELDTDLCRQLGMADSAIFFLESIPWASAGCGDLIKDSEMIDFSEPHCLMAARDPMAARNIHHQGLAAGNQTSREGLDGAMLSLTFCGQTGHALVVDTVRGTIRKWDGSDRLLDAEERDASAVLDEIYHGYLSLAEIPYELDILQPTQHLVYGILDEPAEYVTDTRYVLVKSAAMDHGWPDSFSKEDFKRTAARWLQIMGGNDSSSDDSISFENDEELPNGIF